MRSEGKLTVWYDEKGYGFITPSCGGERVFVHIKAFGNRGQRPATNQMVTYSLASDKQGRTCAANATLAGNRSPKKKTNRSSTLAFFVAVVFFLIVVASVLVTKIPPLVLAIYVAASTVTFITYAMDKSAATKGAWRTSESTLHLLSLSGGWPGALIAQQILRHKSSKKSFRIVFWATVLLNCGAFVWLFTPKGAAALQSLIASVSLWIR